MDTSYFVSSSNSYSLGRQTSAGVATADIADADLINFLSVVQGCRVDSIPITWQDALGILGSGGSGKISQSSVKADMDFAYKRFHYHASTRGLFMSMMSEVLILTQPLIREHPSIINLEGVCWEVDRMTEASMPVLVFERATWDLQQFMESQEGMNISIDAKLGLCADIASAISVMHDYNVVHGDIKPQNILVFKAHQGNPSFKVSDFGYSTLVVDGEHEIVYLPRSTPWYAPEHHPRGFTPSQAKKTDIYSFGMLCLWTLFKQNPGLSDLARVEQLKREDKLKELARELVDGLELPGERKSALEEMFNKTLAKDPEARTLDLEALLQPVNPDRVRNPAGKASYPNKSTKAELLAKQGNFQIARDLFTFMALDYRVRAQIRKSLESSYHKHPTSPDATNRAFQLAFCYKIGFGTYANDTTAGMWLQLSQRGLEELEVEKSLVQYPELFNSRLDDLYANGVMRESLGPNDYLAGGRSELAEAVRVYLQDAEALVKEFGEYHPIVSVVKMNLATLQDGMGSFKEAKEIREKIYQYVKERHKIDELILRRSEGQMIQSFLHLGQWGEAEAIQKSRVAWAREYYGPGHLETAYALTGLGIIHSLQGKSGEGEKLRLEALEIRKRMLGAEHPESVTSMANLASTYFDQARLSKAEDLQVKVVELRKRILGQEHPDTISSIASLATTYHYQGRWKEAEEAQVEVLHTRKRILGPEHPDTMSSLENLASTYREQGRWGEAEKIQVESLDRKKRVLGPGHPRTIMAMVNLASTYGNQGRYDDACKLELEAVDLCKKNLGLEHPHTISSMGSVAATYFAQGRLHDATKLTSETLEVSKRVFGAVHPETLMLMNNLAAMFTSQGQLTDAAQLQAEVLDMRRKVLGPDHPNTSTSMGNLAVTYQKQERWTEAEVLQLELLANSKKYLGPEHPDTLIAMGNLATTYSSQRRFVEAENLEVELLEISMRILGPNHPKTVTAKCNLALTYRDRGRWIEAEKLLAELLQIYKRLSGPDHPTTLNIMGNLAGALYKQGRISEAEKLEVEVLEIRTRTLGPAHPHTATSRRIVASISQAQGR